MSLSPKRECCHPGCYNLVEQGRCTKHKAQQQRPPDDRPSAWKRGYGRSWSRLRKMVLNRDRWICMMCGRTANEVDHITPLADGGTNALDNLQSLCKSCHSHKTAREDGGFGRTNDGNSTEDHYG